MGKEHFTYKLLVEGKDDACVIAALCETYALTENFDIIDCSGIDNLFAQLRLRLTTPQHTERIAVVIDADDNLQTQWERVKHIFTTAEGIDFDLLQLNPEGGIFATTSVPKKVGVWIMPNNDTSGMLEDFLLELTTPDDLLLQQSEAILSTLEARQWQRYIPAHRSKAQIHTFLAWQNPPGRPYGQALTQKILSPTHPAAQIFVDWLKRMFGEEKGI